MSRIERDITYLTNLTQGQLQKKKIKVFMRALNQQIKYARSTLDFILSDNNINLDWQVDDDETDDDDEIVVDVAKVSKRSRAVNSKSAAPASASEVEAVSDGPDEVQVKKEPSIIVPSSKSLHIPSHSDEFNINFGPSMRVHEESCRGKAGTSCCRCNRHFNTRDLYRCKRPEEYDWQHRRRSCPCKKSMCDGCITILQRVGEMPMYWNPHLFICFICFAEYERKKTARLRAAEPIDLTRKPMTRQPMKKEKHGTENRCIVKWNDDSDVEHCVSCDVELCTKRDHIDTSQCRHCHDLVQSSSDLRAELSLIRIERKFDESQSVRKAAKARIKKCKLEIKQIETRLAMRQQQQSSNSTTE